MYSWIPQFPATVMDVALMGRLGHGRPFGPYSRKDKEIVGRALDQVGLYSLLKKPFSSISGGQRQRLFIAVLWLANPSFCFWTNRLQIWMWSWKVTCTSCCRP